MGFSILQDYTSGGLLANNDDIYSVVQQSDISPTKHEYKFIAQVIINGQEVTRMKSFPEPGTDKGVFNVKRIASSFTKSHMFPQYGLLTTGSIFQRCEESTAEIQLVYGEEYFDENGTWVQNLGSASGETAVLIHAATWKGEQMKKYNPGEIFYPGIASCLTKAKEIKTYPEFPVQFLYYYNVNDYAYSLSIKTYDRLNNLLSHVRVPNTYSDDNGMQRVLVGLSALQELQFTHAYIHISGSSNIYQEGITDHWEVELWQENQEPSHQPLTIYLDNECITFANPLQVFWLNNLGGFDSFLFNQQNIFSSKKETQSYQKVLGKLIDNEYVVNTYDQSTVSYLNQLTDNIELKKDFLTEEEVLILKGLFASPVIYFRGRDGIFYAANKIEQGDYKLFQRNNGQQKNFSLTFTLMPSIGYQTQLQ